MRIIRAKFLLYYGIYFMFSGFDQIMELEAGLEPPVPQISSSMKNDDETDSPEKQQIKNENYGKFDRRQSSYFF